MGMNDYCSAALYLLLTVSWCHHPETHNAGPTHLVVVVCYIPTKTTAFWLTARWHRFGLVKWIDERNKPRCFYTFFLGWSLITLINQHDQRRCGVEKTCLKSDELLKFSVLDWTLEQSLLNVLQSAASWQVFCPTFLHPCCVAQLGDHECVSNYWVLSPRPSA